MESEFFEEWFREILLRDIEKLEKKVLIVMDNARFHRKNILEKIIKGTGHCLLFLPPYSPDLNPIEKLWANMKKKLKDIAHNFNTLEEAVTSVLFNKLVHLSFSKIFFNSIYDSVYHYILEFWRSHFSIFFCICHKSHF